MAVAPTGTTQGMPVILPPSPPPHASDALLAPASTWALWIPATSWQDYGIRRQWGELC